MLSDGGYGKPGLMSGSARTSSPYRGRSPAAEPSPLQRPEREGVGAAPRVPLLGGLGLGEEGSAGGGQRELERAGEPRVGAGAGLAADDDVAGGIHDREDGRGLPAGDGQRDGVALAGRGQDAEAVAIIVAAPDAVRGLAGVDRAARRRAAAAVGLEPGGGGEREGEA